ncbi:PLP-dependent aminotransferase family protein [Crenobacter cavernae]|uniref:Putative 8-amino-7-oxononanoate synthase n=1 Tax=Crenobacter cavernae TaxID=2290923 RepID=A0ABY0F9S9_9NEIS|nr:PLP-dependent aminotransferase family protein [Crenobacter cavernae]RXZ42231.1 PLP-dependent aminotransferase family protein [Crenobacter cavernae]
MLRLDRASPVPLTEQIVAALSDDIAAGRLTAGTRLPSIRQFADKFDVSPYTVINAYDRLVALGRIASRQGAGFFVCRASAEPQDPARLDSGGEIDAMWLTRRILEAGDHLVSGSGFLPPAWLEDTLSPSLIARALREAGDAHTHEPAPPQGLPALREQLALKLRAQGIPADAGRLLVTNGATQAIDLVCRQFLRPGDAVVVEEPGYHILFNRLVEAGVRVLPMPRRPDGPDVDRLEALVREYRPRMVFVQSVLHNPTGWDASAPVLHRLLTLAERHDFLIAEDDVYGDLHPGEPLRLAQLSGLRRVIYFGSFSKVLSPAMRLGFVCAEPSIIDSLLGQRVGSVLTGSRLDELLLIHLLQSGRFRKHLARTRERLARARTRSLSTLAEAGFDTSGAAEHGLFLWLPLPDGVDADALVRDAYDNGILLAPGRLFMPLGDASRYLRFSAAASGYARLVDYFRARFAALEGWRTMRLPSPPG